MFLQPSVFLQVKRKLDLDSDHQYVSTTRPSVGQATPSTPAPPRGTHTNSDSLFCWSIFPLSPKFHRRTNMLAEQRSLGSCVLWPLLPPVIVLKNSCSLSSAQTTACQPASVFTRLTWYQKNFKLLACSNEKLGDFRQSGIKKVLLILFHLLECSFLPPIGLHQ